MLHVLAVDDEVPALEELAYLLRRDPRVAEVRTANDGAQALLVIDRALEAGRPLDAVFLDIGMPGLDGVAIARLVSRFAHPPRVVFVTAHDDYAVDAFSLHAADYVLKPVHPERLAEAVRRVADESHGAGDTAERTAASPPEEAAQVASDPPEEVICVELAGVTRFVKRSEILYAEAHGDYARLHTSSATHLVRTSRPPWRSAGAMRDSSASIAPISSPCARSGSCGSRPDRRVCALGMSYCRSVGATSVTSGTFWYGRRGPARPRVPRRARAPAPCPRRDCPAASPHLPRAPGCEVTGGPDRSRGDPGADSAPTHRITVAHPRTLAALGGRQLPATGRAPVADDLGRQTPLGDIYLRSLMRAQLRLGLAVVGALVAVLGGLPFLFLAAPSLHDATVAGVPDHVADHLRGRAPGDPHTRLRLPAPRQEERARLRGPGRALMRGIYRRHLAEIP